MRLAAGQPLALLDDEQHSQVLILDLQAGPALRLATTSVAPHKFIAIKPLQSRFADGHLVNQY